MYAKFIWLELCVCTLKQCGLEELTIMPHVDQVFGYDSLTCLVLVVNCSKCVGHMELVIMTHVTLSQRA